MDKFTLSEQEIDFLISVQAANADAKIELADLEVNYQLAKEQLLKKIAKTSNDMVSMFSSTIRSRNLDPQQYMPDISTGMIVEKNGESEPKSILEDFVPLHSDDSLAKMRTGAVKFRLIDGEEK